MAAADHRKQREPGPPRDPSKSRLSTRSFVRVLVGILAGMSVLTGVTYLIGPVPTSPSLVAMAALWPFDALGGMRAWGALMVVAGVLIAARWYLAGHGLAALVFLIWAGCSAVTIAQGTASAASGPTTIGSWAVVHMWMLYAHRASRWSP